VGQQERQAGDGKKTSTHRRLRSFLFFTEPTKQADLHWSADGRKRLPTATRATSKAPTRMPNRAESKVGASSAIRWPVGQPPPTMNMAAVPTTESVFISQGAA